KTYMYMEDGWNAGYFAWSCATDGKKNAYGPAPDGEEFFAMALFFASRRWGDGEGIFNYSAQARELLHTCVHKGENGTQGGPMWNPENKLIEFVVGCGFSDPSYHCPHFYELFAEYANEEDREFWKEAAKASREYLKKACHPVTGLNAEYAEYDGSPKVLDEEAVKMFGSRHDWFYSDAYRTIANIALDYEWFGKSEELREIADKVQKFFAETVKDHPEQTYLIDGTVLEQPALHPVGLLATNAQASLAAKGAHAKEFVMKFWNTPLRKGDRRYYDNCLYLFALLALSGNYRAW
ncbi:MAG: glycosyl hydrolase family 8, partial [Lachnospiraceae bacterium]|nr:glycosyl hydrolase family 8 [Lachnospiraceae bacterium]